MCIRAKWAAVGLTAGVLLAGWAMWAAARNGEFLQVMPANRHRAATSDPVGRPSLGTLRHQGVEYDLRDLTSEVYRAASDDPFVKSFNTAMLAEDQSWAGTEPLILNSMENLGERAGILPRD